MANEAGTMERLNAARRPPPPTAKETTASADAPKVVSGTWLLLFLAAGFFWLLGLLFNLIIPVITVLMNYLIVLGLWMWAKGRGLKPPTFATAAKGVGKLAGPTGRGAGGIARAAEAVPGSDLIYILLGGITPLIYLSALWWNNR